MQSDHIMIGNLEPKMITDPILYSMQTNHHLSLQTFTIAGPFAGNVGANTVKDDGAVGQCRTDTFSATGTQGGSPVICGVNTGQHSKVFDLFLV